jgi:hypothetical protein
MVLLDTWDEFSAKVQSMVIATPRKVDAAPCHGGSNNNLTGQSRLQTRYSIKYVPKKAKMCMKVTDGAQVIP